MATTTFPDPPVSPTLTRRRFTPDEYAWLIAEGFFDGERLELIDGELIEIMPQKPAHRLVVSLVLPIALRWSGDTHHVLCQSPLRLGESVPEPDIAIVPGQPRDYRDAHPTAAALIVEVSDTTLEYDRTTKALLYAHGGIEDYWLINVNNRTLEVRRQPTDSGYLSLQIYSEGDAVAPLAAPYDPVAVADLLP